MTKQWGPPTWYFFHTLAEKIRPEFYTKHRDVIISFIHNTCIHLPCGFCSQHAKTYIRTLNYKSAPTKEHLKRFLFNFHNNINKITHKPPFSNYDRYKKGDLSKIYEYFRYWYCQSSSLSKRFADTRKRKLLVKQIGDYLLQHKTDFIWS